MTSQKTIFEFPLFQAAIREIALEASYGEAIKSVTQVLVPNFAQLCIIDLVNDGTMVRHAFAVDPSLGQPPAILRAPYIDSTEGVMEVFRTQRAMIYSRRWIFSLAQSDDGLQDFTSSGLVSIVVLPLIYASRCIGVVTTGFTSEMTMQDIEPLEMFVQTAAIAIANAEHLANARAAQRKAETAQARLNYLARAGGIFSKSLDESVTLRRFAASLIGDFADGAAIILPAGPNNELSRIVAGIGAADIIDAVAMNASRSARTYTLADRRAVGVPLMSGGRLSGALVFLRNPSRAEFSIDDLTTAEELALRTAQYIENARAFERHRYVSQTLQNAFRPWSLPKLPNLNLAAVYLPGTVDVEIGGDWYDVLTLPNGDIAIAIGDVMGHGIEAAAVMAELRYGMRAHLYTGATPGQCLANLDKLLARSRQDGLFATALIVLVNMTDLSLRIVNAGHSAPLLACAGGVRMVGEVSVPLGLDGGFRAETNDRLREDETCVMYTDGMFEDRAQSYQTSMDQLQYIIVKDVTNPQKMLERLLVLNPSTTDDRTGIAFRRSVP